MSSALPPEQPGSPAPDEDAPPLEPDDADTGPVETAAAEPDPDGWGPQWDDPAPAQSTWAERFEAPLTISPRTVQRQRDPKPFVIGAAVVGVVALVGGLVFWWTTRPPSQDPEPLTAQPSTSATPEPENAEESAQLLRQVPKGYPAGSCEPVDPSEDALAQVVCERNTDPGGPVSATYTLVGDRSALDAGFGAAMAGATRVNCPGNIQSPGPWRRNATPDRISGQLFCGLQDGQPVVVWTDDVKMTVSAVRAGPEGPTFPQLYAWWSSHS
ncbi:hypothetical protein H7J88_23255 [Mycolicibacterium flavescens]|uniref:Serine/threonine protein kinase n=1 Tax=Mycolicibacterium flavescens TaxID=1776 RepID=A0A1E3RJY8_MYCFV|nr:hypothetical protein [Mycolicibacterium flavescens]MCV7282557.1 hypothetical protein [Mycolicibacterium flavescens]ODQ90181.1 hypothetical protein BHQ18_12170 [Mycolicibacterium flavescens]